MSNDLCCMDIDGGGKRTANEAVLLRHVQVSHAAGTDFLAPPINLSTTVLNHSICQSRQHPSHALLRGCRNLPLDSDSSALRAYWNVVTQFSFVVIVLL